MINKCLNNNLFTYCSIVLSIIMFIKYSKNSTIFIFTQQNNILKGLMKQIGKLGWISGDRRLILLSLRTIPSSILSRLQKIWANNNRNYESGPSAKIN